MTSSAYHPYTSLTQTRDRFVQLLMIPKVRETAPKLSRRGLQRAATRSYQRELSTRERSLSPPVGSTEASQSHHITDIGWRRNETWKDGLCQQPGVSFCNPISPTPCVGPWEINGPSCQELNVEVDNYFQQMKKIFGFSVFFFRFGYINPINYNDNEVFCGGVSHQFEKNGGRYFVFLT